LAQDILLSRVMMAVGIIFLVLHLPRTLLALYEVTRIPRILTCMVHGCRLAPHHMGHQDVFDFCIVTLL
jgi:hypothetical protein